MERTFTRSHRGGTGSPLVLLHGFTDTWRSWELVLHRLERHHDVFAPTLPGHAGGPPLPQGDPEDLHDALVAGVIAEMDAAGIDRAHIVGNSLGGFLAFQLAARGRAESLVALAPAGGWAPEDPAFREMLEYFLSTQDEVRRAAPQADAIASTREGRRAMTEMITTNFEHIPAGLLAHQLRSAAACEAAERLLAYALTADWALDAERIDCPVRIVWGTADQLLHWPAAATRYRNEWAPAADYVELDGIGHCPQLDVPLETAELITGFATGA